MKFDEEGMNVFKQAVDNFMAAGESASFDYDKTFYHVKIDLED